MFKGILYFYKSAVPPAVIYFLFKPKAFMIFTLFYL